MPYTPNNPLIPGDPYSYDLKWIVQQIKAWKDPLDSAEKAKASADAAAISAAEAQAAAGSLDIPFVTPEMYGAEGDGVTDDKAAFAAALASGKPVFCHGEKTYCVGVSAISTSAIDMPSGAVLILNGATLQVLNPDNITTYEIVSFNGKTKGVVAGGIIVGDRLVHSGSTGEHGMGVNVFESSEITIKDLYISNCWGDGIYIGGTAIESSNIIVDNIHSYNNRRNGLSLVNGQNVKILNSTFEDTNGTAPQLGIDVETNGNTDIIKNIIISGCSFINNTSGALNVYVHSEDATVNISDISADGLISIIFLDDNCMANITNVLSTPKNGQSAFVVGSDGNSSVRISNASVNAQAGLESVLKYAYNQPHNNIFCDAYVFNGTITRIVLAYDTTSQHNCHNTFNFKDIVVTTPLYIIPNSSDESNSGEIIGSHVIDTSANAVIGAYKNTIIPDSTSSTNLTLLYYSQADHWHQIKNEDNTTHNLISAPFYDLLTQTDVTSVALTQNAIFFYKYDAELNKVLYYIAS